MEAIYQLRINKCGGSTQWNMTQKILKNQTVHEWNNLDKCHKPGVERRKSNTKEYVLYVEKSENSYFWDDSINQ